MTEHLATLGDFLLATAMFLTAHWLYRIDLRLGWIERELREWE